MDKGERHLKQEGPVLSSEAELPGVLGAAAAVALAGVCWPQGGSAGGSVPVGAWLAGAF